MRFACLLVLVLAGCPADDSDEYPIRPGGGGGGGGGGNRPDATPQPDAGPAMSGRVCLVTDLRDWDGKCGMATGLNVTIGAMVAPVGGGGVFSFPSAPMGTTVKVEGLSIVTSITPFTNGQTGSIDVIATTIAALNNLQNDTVFTVTDGNGYLFLDLRDDDRPQVGMTVDSMPDPGLGTGGLAFYDNTGLQYTWETDSTEAFSKALIADVAPGPVMVTATIGTRMATATFPVEADSTTFATLNVPP